RIVASHEVEEVAGSARKHAHRGRAHIQQVAVRTGAVSHAAYRRASSRVPVEVQRLRQSASEQFAKQGRGGGTATNDGDSSEHRQLGLVGGPGGSELDGSEAEVAGEGPLLHARRPSCSRRNLF